MSKNADVLQIIPPNKHSFDHHSMSPGAIKVIDGLVQAGFQAYLVGGSIRDGLLGCQPKDFDVSTDATPEEVKKVFRNARIIGRRFRIVHVRFGREIIEVTTFRGQSSDSSHQVESNTGQLLRDNVYGNMHSDAIRRDFTVNALYYSPENGSVYDYTNGVDDIKKRHLRIIGDPLTRYKEDPVRLLRAIRFSAKLGFAIEEKTAAPIFDNGHLLVHVPPARLFDEILKLFLNGSATASYTLLKDYQLLDTLFPATMAVMKKSPYFKGLISAVMINTDKRIRSDKRVTPAFIYGALLWPAFIYEQHRLVAGGVPIIAAIHQAADTVIAQQLAIIAIPKRFAIPMRQIWELQWRLALRSGKKADKSLEHEKFRAGYDFLLMREAAGEKLNGLGSWWTRYQEATEDMRHAMVDELKRPPNASQRKPRRGKKKTAETTSQDNVSE